MVVYMHSEIGHVITGQKYIFLIVTSKKLYIELLLLTHLHEEYIQPVCVSGFTKKSPLSSSRKRCYYWLAERGLIRKCLPLSGFLEVTVVHFLLAEHYTE